MFQQPCTGKVTVVHYRCAAFRCLPCCNKSKTFPPGYSFVQITAVCIAAYFIDFSPVLPANNPGFNCCHHFLRSGVLPFLPYIHSVVLYQLSYPAIGESRIRTCDHLELFFRQRWWNIPPNSIQIVTTSALLCFFETYIVVYTFFRRYFLYLQLVKELNSSLLPVS